MLETPNAGGIPSSSKCIHHPYNEILYTEFCEAIVRIAHVKYIHLEKVDERVNAMINKDILPLATTKRFPADNTPGSIGSDNRL